MSALGIDNNEIFLFPVHRKDTHHVYAGQISARLYLSTSCPDPQSSCIYSHTDMLFYTHVDCQNNQNHFDRFPITCKFYVLMSI